MEFLMEVQVICPRLMQLLCKLSWLSSQKTCLYRKLTHPSLFLDKEGPCRRWPFISLPCLLYSNAADLLINSLCAKKERWKQLCRISCGIVNIYWLFLLPKRSIVSSRKGIQGSFIVIATVCTGHGGEWNTIFLLYSQCEYIKTQGEI